MLSRYIYTSLILKFAQNSLKFAIRGILICWF